MTNKEDKIPDFTMTEHWKVLKTVEYSHRGSKFEIIQDPAFGHYNLRQTVDEVECVYLPAPWAKVLLAGEVEPFLTLSTEKCPLCEYPLLWNPASGKLICDRPKCDYTSEKPKCPQCDHFVEIDDDGVITCAECEFIERPDVGDLFD